MGFHDVEVFPYNGDHRSEGGSCSNRRTWEKFRAPPLCSGTQNLILGCVTLTGGRGSSPRKILFFNKCKLGEDMKRVKNSEGFKGKVGPF